MQHQAIMVWHGHCERRSARVRMVILRARRWWGRMTTSMQPTLYNQVTQSEGSPLAMSLQASNKLSTSEFLCNGAPP